MLDGITKQANILNRGRPKEFEMVKSVDKMARFISLMIFGWHRVSVYIGINYIYIYILYRAFGNVQLNHIHSG